MAMKQGHENGVGLSNIAYLGAASFFGAAFSVRGLVTNEGLLPQTVNGLLGAILLVCGFGCVALVLVRGSQTGNRRAMFHALVALAFGATTLGIVYNEPQNFYGMASGVFFSVLVLETRERRPQNSQ